MKYFNILIKSFFFIFLFIFVFSPVVSFADFGGKTGNSYECSDGIDNDGDSLIDYPDDKGCLKIEDNSELGPFGGIENPIKADSLYGLIKTILEGLIKIGIPIIALAIIYSGFLFVSARGKPDEIKKAKDALIYTLIGAAVLLGSWAIAQLISETVLQL